MICRSLSLVPVLAALLLARHDTQAQDKPKEKDKAPKVHEVGKGLSFKSRLNDKDARDRVRDQMFSKVFLVQLQKFKAYQIDMKSAEFDCWLRVEDADARQLAEDDDSGGNTDAQIDFVPTVDGVYRIIATSFGPEAAGKFKLSIVEK